MIKVGLGRTSERFSLHCTLSEVKQELTMDLFSGKILIINIRLIGMARGKTND